MTAADDTLAALAEAVRDLAAEVRQLRAERQQAVPVPVYQPAPYYGSWTWTPPWQWPTVTCGTVTYFPAPTVTSGTCTAALPGTIAVN